MSALCNAANSASGVSLSDTGTDSAKQTVDDAETDSGGGSFTQFPTYLSTSGTYQQSDSYSDDTDDSEDGSGDYGSFAVGIDWNAPVTRTFSIDDDDKASGTWGESGMAAVKAGVTQSASGSYSESDSSEDDATDDDKDTGSVSSTVYRDYPETGEPGASTTDDTDDSSSLDSTSKSLGGFTETATFTQALDAGLPSVFTSVSFSASQRDSGNSSESFSTSSSETSDAGFGDEDSGDFSDSTVDSDTDNMSGWTSYQQSGTYTSTQDDGLTTSDVDIVTSQAGALTTADSGGGRSATHELRDFDTYDQNEAWGSADQWATVTASSYSAKNEQTNAGNAGTFVSGSSIVGTSSDDGTSDVSNPSDDAGHTSGGGRWTSSGRNTDAVYTPAGGGETTETNEGGSGTHGTYTSWDALAHIHYAPTPTSSSSLLSPSFTSGPYAGGPGELSLVGNALDAETPYGLTGVAPPPLLAPTPGQFLGTPKIQPIATAPTPGTSTTVPVDFSTVEQKGQATNGALEAAADKMSAGEDNAPMPASGVSQPSRAGAMTGATPQAAPSGRPEPPPLTQEMIDALQAIGDRAGLAGPAAPAAPATPRGGAGVPAAGEGSGLLGWVHGALDVAGVADPTPISDGINAVIYAAEGDWVNLGVSVVSMIPAIGDTAKAGKYGAKALKGAEVAEDIAKAAKPAAKGLGQLSKATEYGIKPYNQLAKQISGTGLQAHHLIEQRFAEVLGVSASKMEAIALTQAEHQAFTNAWRQAIGYVGSKNPITTANATREQILNAAREIYRDYPEILRALGL